MMMREGGNLMEMDEESHSAGQFVLVAKNAASSVDSKSNRVMNSTARSLSILKNQLKQRSTNSHSN